jgi:hypothetical protein
MVLTNAITSRMLGTASRRSLVQKWAMIEGLNAYIWLRGNFGFHPGWVFQSHVLKPAHSEQDHGFKHDAIGLGFRACN